MKPFAKPLLALALLASLLAAACAPAPTTVFTTVPGTTTVTSPGGTTTVTAPGATATPITSPTTPPTSSATTTPPATGPAIDILSPADGSINAPGSIIVTVAVMGFNLAAATGQPNAAGTGLVAFFLDTPPPLPGQPVIPSLGQYALVAATSYTFQNVGPGMHYVFVELTNNDGTPLNPPAVHATYFGVQ